MFLVQKFNLSSRHFTLLCAVEMQMTPVIFCINILIMFCQVTQRSAAMKKFDICQSWKLKEKTFSLGPIL
jgi:hypothetical protein